MGGDEFLINFQGFFRVLGLEEQGSQLFFIRQIVWFVERDQL